MSGVIVLGTESILTSGVLNPQGPIADAERTILFNASVVMLVVIVPVIILTLAFAWWFRASNKKARRLPNWSYSGAIEVTVWFIPTLVILFLGGIAWVGSHDIDPRRPIVSATPAIEIQVVSMDWKWLFIYPDLGVASVNRLVIPVGAPLRLRLTSASVMNSFFVPQLGSQIYTMAGMTTTLNLRADRPGVYAGMSAQFSGDGFSDMKFDTVALERSAFNDWATKTRLGKATLDRTAFDELAKPGVISTPVSYSSVAPNLFEVILGDSSAFLGRTPQGEIVVTSASPPRHD